MRASRLFKRPKAENGAGRSVKIKHVLLPEEVVEDLKLYRDCYADVLGTKVTFEQMLRRWIDQVQRFDPDVATRFNEAKAKRRAGAEQVAAGLGLTAAELEANRKAFDPTKGPVWELRYFFEKDGVQLEAYPGDNAPFYAEFNGRNIGLKAMLRDGWELQNEIGIVIDVDEAYAITKKIKQHKAQK